MNRGYLDFARAVIIMLGMAVTHELGQKCHCLSAQKGRCLAPTAMPVLKMQMNDTTEIRVVFDAQPGRDMPTLVAVQDEYGRTITGGEWRERPDGYWELVFRTAPMLIDPGVRLN